MTKELSWTEAASKVLEVEGKLWMSVPDIIKSLQRSKIKAIDCPYGRACRNLRSALKHHARKENGMFARKQDHIRVLYALRKHLRRSSSPPSPTPSLTESSMEEESIEETALPPHLSLAFPPPLSPALPPPLSPLLPAWSRPATMVEIDPTQCKPMRSHQRSGGVGSFCLPSPLHSMLGPRRTLHVLSESILPLSQRPVRNARQKRGSRVKAGDEPLPPKGPSLSPTTNTALKDVLCLETHFSMTAQQADVAFVKTECSGDPSTVQGERQRSQNFLIFPDDPDLSTDSSDSEEDDVESGDGEAEILLQPTPMSKLLVKRSLLAQLVSQPFQDSYPNPAVRSCAEASQAAGRRSSEPLDRSPQAKPSRQRTLQGFLPAQLPHRSYSVDLGQRKPRSRRPDTSRIISSLFTSTSPLISENLKALLNESTFAALSDSQKKKVVLNLPPVDRRGDTQLIQGSLSNSFLSSMLREWQERLATGMFTPEYRARMRSDEKKRNAMRADGLWKQQYYEDHWGERHEEQLHSSFTPFYPSSQTSTLLSNCLGAITHPCKKSSGTPPAPSLITSPTTSPCDNQLTVKPHPPLPANQRNHTVTRNTAPATVYKSLAKEHKSVAKAIKVHVKSTKPLTKVHKPPAKFVLKRLKSSPTRHTLSNSLIHHFLTPLPRNTSYRSLLATLRQETKPPSPSPSPHSPPPPHKHSVFHDHFALLASQHVPEEFSGPVKSLVLHIPREHHTMYVQCRTSRLEHSYARSGRPCLPVSLPRSLLATECVCKGEPMVYCPHCLSLYHTSCARQCPGCSV